MKLWKKRVLSGLLAGVMALWMVGAALAAPETGSPSQARSGVARVVALYEMDVYTEKGGDYVATVQGCQQGSAFGVGTVGEETDIFVTNRHVVTLEEEKGDLQLEGYTFYQESTITGYYILLDNFAYNTETFTLDTSRSIPCTVVYLGEKDDEDVAVLRAAETVPGRTALALLADENSLEVGDGVTALGFPAISDSATSEGYLLATVDDMTLTNGVVSRFFDSVSATTSDGLLSGRLIQSTAAINGGNSGGPLVDETGTVVGINTYTVSSQDSSVTTAYYALRIQYAKDALDKLGIAYDVSGQTSGGLPVGVILAVAAVVVLAVVVIIVVLRKKKAAPEPLPQPQPEPVLAPDPSDSGYRIQGVSGALEGRCYRIPASGSILLGRDESQCGVVFPTDTPGVSGRHCAVWFENGTVYLKDLGSSHGTFLSPGSRLAAQQTVRLMPGNVFFLGSQEQSFVLTERR